MNRLVVLFAFFFTYYQIDGIRLHDRLYSFSIRTAKVPAQAPLPLLYSFKKKFGVRKISSSLYGNKEEFAQNAPAGSIGFCFGKKHGYKKRGSKYSFFPNLYIKNLSKLLVKHSNFKKFYLKESNRSTLTYIISLKTPQTSFVKTEDGDVDTYDADWIQLKINGGFASISPVVPPNIMLFAQ